MIDVDGTYNFRDVGGITTIGGELVLPRLVYRSASLDSVTPAGLATLAELGIRTVIDIRSEAELERNGRFPHEGTGIEWFHVVSSVGPPSGEDATTRAIWSSPDPMALVFKLLVTSASPMLAGALRLVAEAGRQPVVFHCTSGKDRTGMVALLTQLIVGVDLETALVDFERSTAALAMVRSEMAARYPQLSSLPAEVLDRMATADRVWVHGALEEIGGQGNLEPWLDSIGVDATLRHRLRTVLLAG